MSLDFDLRDIPEETRLVDALVDQPIEGIKAGDKIMSPITNALIWSTMAVGIGSIDDETAEEFFYRLEFLRKLGLYGSITLWEGDAETGTWGEPRGVTLEEVQAHKGLRTNVTHETRASFVKRWIAGAPVFPVDEPKRKR